jgi:hypothetical protein
MQTTNPFLASLPDPAALQAALAAYEERQREIITLAGIVDDDSAIVENLKKHLYPVPPEVEERIGYSRNRIRALRGPFYDAIAALARAHSAFLAALSASIIADRDRWIRRWAGTPAIPAESNAAIPEDEGALGRHIRIVLGSDICLRFENLLPSGSVSTSLPATVQREWGESRPSIPKETDNIIGLRNRAAELGTWLFEVAKYPSFPKALLTNDLA